MRYLVRKDNKILGPMAPEDLIHIAGFSEASLVCPENQNGAQPDHWQQAGATPEIKSLILAPAPAPDPKTTAGFQLPAPVPPIPPAAQPAKGDELGPLLAALDRRTAMIEQAAQAAPAPPPRKPRRLIARVAQAVGMGAEPGAAPATAAPPPPAQPSSPAAPTMHDLHNTLHERISTLEERLHERHQSYLQKLASIEDKTEKGLQEVKNKVEGMVEKAEVKAMETTKKETRWLIDWDKITDYKAAMGGLFTMATGVLVAAGGLLGLFFKIKNLKPEEWGQFLATLPQQPFVVAIVGSGAVISTGLHQIGIANNHGEIMDSHQQLRDSHQQLVDSHQQLLDSHQQLMDSHANLSAQFSAAPAMPAPAPAPAPASKPPPQLG